MQVNSIPAVYGTIQRMGHAARIIAIHTAAAQPGCGACQHNSGTPVCRAALGEGCAAPRLQGSPPDLRRLMIALGPALGFAADVADAGAGVVVSLSVQPGEVDLCLAAGLHCGGAALADAAFQTLRGLLPDTDIYVNSAA